MAAAHYRAGHLVAIVDRNQLSIDGPTEAVMGVEPLDRCSLPSAGQVTASTATTSTPSSTPFASPPRRPHGTAADASSPTRSRAAACSGWSGSRLARRQPRRHRLRRRAGRARGRPAAAGSPRAGDEHAPASDQSRDLAGRSRHLHAAAAALRDSARSTDGSDISAAIPAFVAGEELADLADDDERIVVLTADLAEANRATDFAERHPDRFFNIGIAEKNMISVAAGMAATGWSAYAATFACVRGAARLRADPHRPGLPAPAGADRSATTAGISMGFYGTSHHSLEDLGADAHHRRPHGGLRHRRQPAARDPAGLARPSRPPCTSAWAAAATPRCTPKSRDFEFGKAIRLTRGRRPDHHRDRLGGAALPATRPRSGGRGRHRGPGRRHAHAEARSTWTRSIAAATTTAAILTVEEHNVTNGLGTAVAEVLLEARRRRSRFQPPRGPRRARPRSARPPRCTPTTSSTRPASPAGPRRFLAHRGESTDDRTCPPRAGPGPRIDALRARAARVIPGRDVRPPLASGCCPPQFPQFYDRGRGARVWDVDGNEFVDLMCSFGPMIMGYARCWRGAGRRRAAGAR